MFWSVVAHLAALLLDLVMARRQSEGAKDLEIAVLRHQLRMLERRGCSAAAGEAQWGQGTGTSFAQWPTARRYQSETCSANRCLTSDATGRTRPGMWDNCRASVAHGGLRPTTGQRTTDRRCGDAASRSADHADGRIIPAGWQGRWRCRKRADG